MSQLVTGEAVALDLHEAALPSRMLAALLDGLLQVGLFFLLILLVAAAPPTSGAATAAVFVTIFIVVGLIYPVLFETLMRGRTPGKAAMGLRVVRDDAGPIGFRQAFVRGLIGFFVERPGITSFSAAVLTSLLNSHGKRLGDLAAGTVVIQERVSTTRGPVAMMPAPLAGWAQTLDLSHLSDDLALSVRSFIARSPKLTEAARGDLGGRLVAAVAAVVTPPAPPGTPGWAYLSAVLAERRRRAEHTLHPVYGGAVPATAPVPFYGTPAPPSPPAVPAAPAPAAPQPAPGGFVAPF